MKLGVVFPQLEIGADPIAVRDLGQAAEASGFDHVIAYDHVVGAHPDRFESGSIAHFGDAPYSHRDNFHEVFVLFGYLAGLTEHIELATGVLVLPQRQTALVAKQAAEVDVLSGGRLRLGVGLGWNHVEYEALGEDFGTRGRRLEEQIAVLRSLWTNELVQVSGSYHSLDRVGIAPLPVQRPIPIWIGGLADAALRRAAEMADGWFALGYASVASGAVDRLRHFAEAAGRDPSVMGIQGVDGVAGSARAWAESAGRWAANHATHLAVNTMRNGFSVQEHIDAIVRWKEAVDGVCPT